VKYIVPHGDSALLRAWGLNLDTNLNQIRSCVFVILITVTVWRLLVWIETKKVGVRGFDVIYSALKANKDVQFVVSQDDVNYPSESRKWSWVEDAHIIRNRCSYFEHEVKLEE
jgi:hypothetical protein